MLKFSSKYQSSYLIAIVATLILVCSTQLFIQHALREKATDANLINISGRQRMLSQQLLQLVYQCHLPSSVRCRQDKISQVYEEWENAHRYIASQPMVLDEAEEAIEVRIMLGVLQEKIGKVESLITKAGSLTSNQLLLLQKNQSEFLSTMDKVVKHLEKFSTQKLTYLTRIELFLAFLTLVVLTLEFLFIFRPIISELLARNEALQKSRDIIKQYAYVASSDLRIPVDRIIRSLLKLRPIITTSKLSKDGHNAVDEIEQNALNLQYISRDLAIYSEVLTKAPNLMVISFWDILNDLLEVKEEHIWQADAKIQIGQIPNFIKVDGKLFHLLWQHLIQNALEYRRKDTSLIITITGHSDEENWYFSISDNGQGITEAEKVTLFDLFRSVQQTDNRTNTGLGLPLAKQIVEQHQGEITVDSQVDKGTKINIRIPRGKKHTKLRTLITNRQTLSDPLLKRTKDR